ncbi:MAG TPA: hypothetical protein VF011_05580 [Terriglobales bacterium]
MRIVFATALLGITTMLGTGGCKIDLHSCAQPSTNFDFSCDGFRMTGNSEVS